jgi:hypothetical protein
VIREKKIPEFFRLAQARNFRKNSTENFTGSGKLMINILLLAGILAKPSPIKGLRSTYNPLNFQTFPWT